MTGGNNGHHNESRSFLELFEISLDKGKLSGTNLDQRLVQSSKWLGLFETNLKEDKIVCKFSG